VLTTGVKRRSTYSTPDLKRGLKFLEAEYAEIDVLIVLPIRGCDVVRSDNRGSACDPSEDGGNVRACCGGD